MNNFNYKPFKLPNLEQKLKFTFNNDDFNYSNEQCRSYKILIKLIFLRLDFFKIYQIFKYFSILQKENTNFIYNRIFNRVNAARPAIIPNSIRELYVFLVLRINTYKQISFIKESQDWLQIYIANKTFLSQIVNSRFIDNNKVQNIIIQKIKGKQQKINYKTLPSMIALSNYCNNRSLKQQITKFLDKNLIQTIIEEIFLNKTKQQIKEGLKIIIKQIQNNWNKQARKSEVLDINNSIVINYLEKMCFKIVSDNTIDQVDANFLAVSLKAGVGMDITRDKKIFIAGQQTIITQGFKYLDKIIEQYLEIQTEDKYKKQFTKHQAYFKNEKENIFIAACDIQKVQSIFNPQLKVDINNIVITFVKDKHDYQTCFIEKRNRFADHLVCQVRPGFNSYHNSYPYKIQEYDQIQQTKKKSEDKYKNQNEHQNNDKTQIQIKQHNWKVKLFRIKILGQKTPEQYELISYLQSKQFKNKELNQVLVGFFNQGFSKFQMQMKKKLNLQNKSNASLVVDSDDQGCFCQRKYTIFKVQIFYQNLILNNHDLIDILIKQAGFTYNQIITLGSSIQKEVIEEFEKTGNVKKVAEALLNLI